MKTPRKVVLDFGDDQGALETLRRVKVGQTLKIKGRPPLKVTNITTIQEQEFWELAPL